MLHRRRRRKSTIAMTLTKSIKSQRMQGRALCWFSLLIHWWAQLLFRVNSRPDVPINYPPSPRLRHKVFIFNASVLSESQGCLFAKVFPDGRHMGSRENGDVFCCWTLSDSFISVQYTVFHLIIIHNMQRHYNHFFLFAFHKWMIFKSPFTSKI